ncbi:MAG: hypothetical protein ABJA94_12350 [Rhodoglobus sp.]
MINRLLPVVWLGIVLLLLAGCSATISTSSGPSESASGATSAAPDPNQTNGAAAEPATSLIAGDCTAAEMEVRQPTVYTVYTGDSDTPVTIHYTAFNHDGTNPTVKLTTVGPVINILGYACNEASVQADWILTATHGIDETITCVQDFGGRILSTETKKQANATVDCTGNPGR